MENKQIKEEPDVPRQKSKCQEEPLDSDNQTQNEEESIIKVKRLFSSLVHHAKDHSTERGDSVGRLITNLVVGSINFDEFEKSLIDLIKSSPRTYVISYLRAFTPSLQKEMAQAARNSKMNVVDYVTTHLFDSEDIPCKSDVFGDSLKRRREKNYEDDYSPPSSRPLLVPVHPLAASNPINQPLRSSNEEQWRNIDVMLNCILSMVEKTIAAIGILQGRTADDLMAQTIRLTEDRVAQVKKRAEEAVAEVNRKALLELQRAVSAAETRANQLAAADLPRRADKIQISGPHNSCWNCGRKAQETCSGCNVAKYCSSFCQHKDWENHHATCRNKFK